MDQRRQRYVVARCAEAFARCASRGACSFQSQRCSLYDKGSFTNYVARDAALFRHTRPFSDFAARGSKFWPHVTLDLFRTLPHAAVNFGPTSHTRYVFPLLEPRHAQLFSNLPPTPSLATRDAIYERAPRAFAVGVLPYREAVLFARALVTLG